MYWFSCIALTCILLGPEAVLSFEGSCSQTCPAILRNISTVGTPFRSPACNGSYPNDLACELTLMPHNQTFTQMTFVAFDLESWQDFLKFDGPENFILFANETSNQMIMTGYPNATIKSEFITDSTGQFAGYNFTASSVTASELLVQYEGYDNSSAQVMRSPLYLTSYDDENTTNTMDILALNLEEVNQSLPSAWQQYVELIGATDTIEVYDFSPTGFYVNWTAIAGSVEYTITIRKEAKTHHTNTTRKREFTASNLPSGTRFTIEVNYTDKNGVSARVATNGTTEVASVKKLQMEVSTNSSIDFSWEKLDGAKRYHVVVRNGSTSKNHTVDSASIQLNSLSTGSYYDISVIAEFEIGHGPMVNSSGWTLAADVTNLMVQNRGALSYEATWSPTSERNVSYKATLQSKNSEKELEKPIPGGVTFETSPGVKYTLMVQTRNPGGLSESKISYSFETPLSAPTINFDSISKSQFQIKFGSVAGASGYTYSCDSDKVQSSTETKEAWITGLKPKTNYSCTVYAYSADGVKSSAVSDSVVTAKEPCEKNPCQNNGECYADGNDAACNCGESYEGTRCENIKDWCGNGKAKLCKENSACKNDPDKVDGVCICNAGFTGDGLVGCVEYCEGGEYRVKNETLLFSATEVGRTVYSDEKCPDGRARGSATCIATQTGAAFGKFQRIPCNESLESNIPDSVPEGVTSTDLEEETSTLQVLTSNRNNTLPLNATSKVSRYIESVTVIAKNQTVSQDVLSNVVNTVDNLIESKSLSTAPTTTQPPPTGIATPAPSRQDEAKMIKKRILSSMNTLANNVEFDEGQNKSDVIGVNLMMRVMKAPANEPAVFAPILTDSKDGSMIGNMTQTIAPVSITVPQTALKQNKDGNTEYVRVSFFLHKTAVLFPSDKGVPSVIVAANVGKSGKRIELSSGDVFMTFVEKRNFGIKDNTRFKRTITRYSCSYWDVAAGDWKTDGCVWVLNATGRADCACNHLTNFAVLVAKDKLDPNIELEIVSVIGLSLSMLGLVLTIIIHAAKEEVRKRRPTRILFHICTNLLISSIVFIVGIDKYETRLPCTIIAIVMHYFFLVSWTWMAIYAYDMYRSLVKVFGVGQSRYMTKCTIFGYGLPLLITLLDAGVTIGHIDPQRHTNGTRISDSIDYEKYRESAYVAENICWIHDYSLTIGFLLPVGIMIAFNIFVYCMVMKTIRQRGNAVKSSAKKSSWKDDLFISITLISSTGIAWVFAYLMLISQDQNYLNVMSWIFAVLNSIQGLVIFLSTCVRNQNMRKIWMQPLSGCFSSAGSRMRSYTSKSAILEINPKSGNEGTSFSSSSTKGTTVHSTSAKEMASESAM